MSLMDILQRAVPLAMLVFVLSSMVAMGLGLTVAQIIAPLRNLRLVVDVAGGEFCVDATGGRRRSPRCCDSTNRWAWGCCCWARPPARRSCRSWLRSPRGIWRSRWA